MVANLAVSTPAIACKLKTGYSYRNPSRRCLVLDWRLAIGGLEGFFGLIGGGMRRLTTQEFVTRAMTVHGNRYSYEVVRYQHSQIKVEIVCQSHGSFMQAPSHHLQGRGCPRCGGSGKRDTAGFVEVAKNIHGNKYSYEMVEYKGIHAKIEITCLEHGLFGQRANDHLQGSGCPQCGGSKRLGTTEFIRRAKTTHGNKYSYEAVKYRNAQTGVKIGCSKHGWFNQSPHHHLEGAGCPACSESIGETKVTRFLQCYNIYFEREKRFAKCKHKAELPFDFCVHLDNKTFLIEVDGGQHRFPVDHFGGKSAFKKRQFRDVIKTQFAHDYGFILIRIPDTIKDINQYLQSEIEKRISFPLTDLLISKLPDEKRKHLSEVNPDNWYQLSFAMDIEKCP